MSKSKSFNFGVSDGIMCYFVKICVIVENKKVYLFIEYCQWNGLCKYSNTVHIVFCGNVSGVSWYVRPKAIQTKIVKYFGFSKERSLSNSQCLRPTLKKASMIYEIIWIYNRAVRSKMIYWNYQPYINRNKIRSSRIPMVSTKVSWDSRVPP